MLWIKVCLSTVRSNKSRSSVELTLIYLDVIHVMCYVAPNKSHSSHLYMSHLFKLSHQRQDLFHSDFFAALSLEQQDVWRRSLRMKRLRRCDERRRNCFPSCFDAFLTSVYNVHVCIFIYTYMYDINIYIKCVDKMDICIYTPTP